MKHLLYLLALLALVTPVYGLSLTFQNPSDFTSYVTCTGAGCTYVQSTTDGEPDGRNNYILVPGYPGPGYLRNVDPLPTTYAAASLIGYHAWISGPVGKPVTRLYDNAGNQMATYTWADIMAYGRYEIIIVGGSPMYYHNGALVDTGAVLTQNPSYIEFGGTPDAYYGGAYYLWDDFVYGSTENRNIFGAPEQGYFIRKDMINPAASGLYRSNGTLVSSNNMTATWGVGDNNASHTVILEEWGGNLAASYITTAGTQAGSISWPLAEIIDDPFMPYGYYVTTIAGSGKYSERIPYISYGASVAFGQSSYARGDIAVVTYAVDSGGYWDPVIYSYRLDTLDVYGNVVDTQTVSTQSGTANVAFTPSDPLGVYYAVLIATPIAGGSDIWMNFDSAELTGYLVLTGNVYDAESGLFIPVANISISQGSTIYNKDTAVDGNYTTNVAFMSGAAISINVTAAGYQQYLYNFTPLEAKTISLDFTLVSLTPTTVGVSIGGVSRDSVYGRPIPSAQIVVANSTYSESHLTTTNAVGWYLIGNLANGRCYTVTATKTGYSTKSYIKCVSGV